MKKVYIAHPLRGAEREKNVAEVTKICKKITELFPEVIPISPIHAFSFLDGCGEAGEKKALDLCLELVKTCDELWLFGKWEKSVGCHAELEAAARDEKIDITNYSPESVVYIDKGYPYSMFMKWLLEEVYEPELKPCPFCGEKTTVLIYSDVDGEDKKRDVGSIVCQNIDCPAFVRVCWGPHDICKAKAEAIAAWNRRAGE